MDLKERTLAGALGGLGGAFVLAGLRRGPTSVGLMDTTGAPERAVRRAEELGLLEGLSPEAREALTVAAHFAYGVGAGGVRESTESRARGEVEARTGLWKG